MMNTRAPLPDHWLQQHARRLRYAWPLGILIAGLALTLAVSWWRHPAWAQVEKWNELATIWAGGLALTFLLAIAAWIFRRQNLLHNAQSLDARLSAKNRLETALSLQPEGNAIARAQREETARFLQHSAAPPRSSVLPALLAALAFLLLAHLVTLLSWARPWSTPARLAVASPSPSPAIPLPQASIQWKNRRRKRRLRRSKKSPWKLWPPPAAGCAIWCWR